MSIVRVFLFACSIERTRTRASDARARVRALAERGAGSRRRAAAWHGEGARNRSTRARSGTLRRRSTRTEVVAHVARPAHAENGQVPAQVARVTQLAALQARLEHLAGRTRTRARRESGSTTRRRTARVSGAGRREGLCQDKRVTSARDTHTLVIFSSDVCGIPSSTVKIEGAVWANSMNRAHSFFSSKTTLSRVKKVGVAYRRPIRGRARQRGASDSAAPGSAPSVPTRG